MKTTDEIQLFQALKEQFSSETSERLVGGFKSLTENDLLNASNRGWN